MELILARTAIRARSPRTRLRAALRWLLLFPLAAWFFRPLVVRGRVPGGPVVFAANHASHADTVAVLRALPPHARARLAPAAAEDYWFGGRLRAAFARAVIGAFPFPRRGAAGLHRARGIVASGGSVLLFPEGTRSTDGSIGSFRRGVGVLAAGGATIVPVAISGTGDVFAKGAGLPRRAPVVVTFGEPLRFERTTEPGKAARAIEQRVRAHHRATVLPPHRRTWHARARAFARSRAALGMIFAWAIAEAVWLPVVPDVPVALLALAAPLRAPMLVLAAIAGTVAGGAFAAAAGPWLLGQAPLVTERMAEQASAWLAADGAGAVARQPWSGIPYKAFALQLPAEVGMDAFLTETAVARGARFAQVALVFGAGGGLATRWLARVYGPVVVAALSLFTLGLFRVVHAWS